MADDLSRPGSCGAMLDGLVESSLAGEVAAGGDMLDAILVRLLSKIKMYKDAREGNGNCIEDPVLL